MNSSKIGNYRVVSELGRGGMGVVYRAIDERSGQEVALKMLAPEVQTHKDSALRFKREFRAIRRVVHPNVVRVFEAGAHQGTPYFSMELVEGQNIRHWLDGFPGLVHIGKDPPNDGPAESEKLAKLNEPERVRRIAEASIQVCFALSTIHAHRIVHRDLKPDNIMVTAGGVVKLMDFGIAKQLAEHGPSTSGGMVVGTFKYLAPEQALGLEVDGRSDLYCLGIVMFELLAGRHPFYSETSVGYAYHHARTPAPRLADFNPDVPPALADVVERCLRKDPEQRFANAEDLIAAAKAAVSGLDERVDALQASTRRFSLPPFRLSAHPLFAPALVGRDPEKQTLLTAVDRLRNGTSRFVLLEGEHGLGKSRLLKIVEIEAKEQGVEFLSARASSNERAPYAPFVRIFEGVIAQLGQRSRREVQRILGSEGPALARYLPTVAALPMLDSVTLPALAPEDEQIRFRAAAADVLQRFCETKSRVMVLDDADQADELSLDLVQYIATSLLGFGQDHSHPHRHASMSIFLSVSHLENAPQALRQLVEELRGESGFMHLKLRALDEAGAGRLLRSMLGGESLSDDLVSYLYASTQGIPREIEKNLRNLATAGKLLRKRRSWVVQVMDGQHSRSRVVAVNKVTRDELHHLPRKQTGQQEQIAQLSETALDVAERAAIVGPSLSTALLSRIALRPEDELLDALDELLKRDILSENKRVGQYTFASKEFRQGLVQSISPARRARLHLLAAHSFEEISRSDSPERVDPEQLAWHYLEGEEPRRAFDYLAQAAERALQANAVQTAHDLNEKAQEIVGGHQRGVALDSGVARRRLELLRLRLGVLLARSQAMDAIDLGEDELDDLRAVGEARQVAEVLYLMAGAELMSGELDNALRHIAEVVVVTERGGAHLLRCRAKRLAGDIYVRRGQNDRAFDYFADSLNLARSIGDKLEEELVRSAIAEQYLETGELDRARRDYENLLALAEQQGERSRATHYIKSLGRVWHNMGDYKRARASYTRALDMAHAVGDSYSQLLCQSCLGALALDEGEVDAALKAFAEAQDGLLSAGSAEDVILALLGRAQAQLMLGKLVQARSLCDEAMREAERSGLSVLLAHVRIVRGAILCRRGQGQKAIADIEKGLSTARGAKAIRVSLFGQICQCEALFILGEQERAIQVLDKVERQAINSGYLRYRDKVQDLRQRLAITAPGQ